MPLFTPEQGEQVQGLATGIGSILKERFQIKQAETFTSNELAKFQADTAAFQDSLNQFTDPESNDMANAFRQYQSNVVIPFMTTAALKYGDNPRIMSAVQAVDKANKDGLDMWSTVKGVQQKDREANAMEGKVANDKAQEERESTKQQAMLPLQENSEKALTEQRNASAELDRARAGQINDKAGNENDPAKILKEARNPKDYKAKVTMDARTEQNVISRVVAQNRGQLYPSGSGTWGSDPKEDQKQALEYLRQKDILKDVYTAGRAVEMGGSTAEMAQVMHDSGMHTEALQLVIPEISGLATDPIKDMKSKITDKTSDTDMVSVITGTPGGGFANLQDFYDNAVDNQTSYRNLPDPLRNIFTGIKTNQAGVPVKEVLTEDNKGNPKLSKVELRSPKALKDALVENAKEQLMDTAIAPDSVQAKKQVAEFLDKVVEKFYPEFKKQFMTKEQIEEEDNKNSFLNTWWNSKANTMTGRLIKKGADEANAGLNLIKKKAKAFMGE